MVPIRIVPGGRGRRARCSPLGPERGRTRWRVWRRRRTRHDDRPTAACRCARLGCGGMQRGAESPAERVVDRRRRRRRARRALPEPGRRLHDLPAALPLPHHRPAPRAVLPRRRARHAWSTRCSRTSSTCRPPTAPPSRRATCWCPPGSRCSRPSPSSPRCSRPSGEPGDGPDVGELADLLPRRSSTATSRSRTRAGSSPPSASSTSRRCSTPGCCCAASSTGSTSRPTARSGWSTTRPAARPARCSRPRRCSR